MLKALKGLAQHNTEDLKKAFDTIKAQDDDKAKRKYYSKAYYQQNKERYKKYYNENKDAIKEYAKQYKKQNKKKKTKPYMFSIVHKPVIITFGSKKIEGQEQEVDNKLFSQLFSPQPLPSVV